MRNFWHLLTFLAHLIARAISPMSLVQMVPIGESKPTRIVSRSLEALRHSRGYHAVSICSIGLEKCTNIAVENRNLAVRFS